MIFFFQKKEPSQFFVFFQKKKKHHNSNCCIMDHQNACELLQLLKEHGRPWADPKTTSVLPFSTNFDDVIRMLSVSCKTYREDTSYDDVQGAGLLAIVNIICAFNSKRCDTIHEIKIWSSLSKLATSLSKSFSNVDQIKVVDYLAMLSKHDDNVKLNLEQKCLPSSTFESFAEFRDFAKSDEKWNEFEKWCFAIDHYQIDVPVHIQHFCAHYWDVFKSGSERTIHRLASSIFNTKTMTLTNQVRWVFELNRTFGTKINFDPKSQKCAYKDCLCLNSFNGI